MNFSATLNLEERNRLRLLINFLLDCCSLYWWLMSGRYISDLAYLLAISYIEDLLYIYSALMHLGDTLQSQRLFLSTTSNA